MMDITWNIPGLALLKRLNVNSVIHYAVPAQQPDPKIVIHVQTLMVLALPTRIRGGPTPMVTSVSVTLELNGLRVLEHVFHIVRNLTNTS